MLNKFIKIFLSLILFLSSTNLITNAQEIKKLTIDEAIELALEKNLDLIQNKKNIIIAKNNINIANRLQNPELQMLFLTGLTSVGNPQQIGLALPIEVKKRGPRKEKALAEQSFADNNLEYQIFTLKMDVREAYVALAGAKSILTITEKQKETLAKMVDIAQKRFEVGVAPESEYLQAKIFLDQWETICNNALAQVKIASNEFNKTLNLDEQVLTHYDIEDEELPDLSKKDIIKIKTPSPQKDIIPIEKIIEISLQNRKDIILAQKEIEIAQKNLKVIISNRIPDMTLLGGWMYMSPYQNNDEKINYGGALNGAYMGANVQLPTLYRFTPEIKNAQLEIEKKQANLKSIINQANQDINSYYVDFEVAKKNLNYYDDYLVNNSDNVLEKAQRSYEVGKTNLGNLILVEQSHLNIMTNYITALNNYYNCWISLLRTANTEDLN